MRITRTAGKTMKAEGPRLSIGMIFKNEIRCLERCMKALQSVRDAIPCELVMADTGSDDGSHEVAEKYADILFDFPWINDFAAARNAVMDRCSGEWYFSIDCDEWLDEDISDLVAFLTSTKRRQFETAAIVVRNYTNKELNDYGDLLGVRLKRMDTGHRYTGMIHEALPLKDGEVIYRGKTLLHHDGYVVEGGPGGKTKQDRNMPLLEKMLEENPKNLRVIQECIESSRSVFERDRYIRMGIEGVEQRWSNWGTFGPAIMRYGVMYAAEKEKETSEHEKLFHQMMEWFPNSPCTIIDAACSMAQLYSDVENYDEVIHYGELYLRSFERYKNGDEELLRATLFGTLVMASELKERCIRLLLSSAYCEKKRYDDALNMLLTQAPEDLNGELTRNYIGILMNLQSYGGKDLSGYMAGLWEKMTAPESKEALVNERKAALAAVAGNCFQKNWRNKETEEGRCHAYTLFLPLEGKCEAGLAAAVLETEDPAVLTEKLLTVENWDKFSVHALAHALERGVQFPLPGKPLTVEEMDKLADRLSKTGDVSTLAIESLRQTDTPERLCWSRGLFLSAMNAEANRLRQAKALLESAGELTELDEDPEQNEEALTVIRTFAEAERKFLADYYAPGILTEENLLLLPPMHRFGWYCAQAFTALGAGDSLGYVRSLKAGLALCKSMQPIVEFLLEHTPELQSNQPSPELLALAEKVRSMLEMFAPDDPAVAALKESAAYQRVAHLVEKTSVVGWGGLIQ